AALWRQRVNVGDNTERSARKTMISCPQRDHHISRSWSIRADHRLSASLGETGGGERNEAPNVGSFYLTTMTEAAAPERPTIAPKQSILISVEGNNSNDQREEDQVHCQEEQRWIK